MFDDMKANGVPIKAEERRAWIKYQLELLGCSFASIARENSITRMTVQSVLRRPYPKMERLIANKLGLQPEDLWPERYPLEREGSRKGRRKQ